jgi:hypothetical protein
MNLIFNISEFLGLKSSTLILVLIISLIVVIDGIIFFILLKFLKRSIKDIIEIIFATFFITLIITPIVYFLIVLSGIYIISYYPDKYFDRNEWINNENKRYEMTKFLIDSRILIGKTKKEVIEYLGPTDTTKNIIDYYVGFLPGPFSIDPDIIEIYFVFGKAISVRQRGT